MTIPEVTHTDIESGQVVARLLRLLVGEDGQPSGAVLDYDAADEADDAAWAELRRELRTRGLRLVEIPGEGYRAGWASEPEVE